MCLRHHLSVALPLVNRSEGRTRPEGQLAAPYCRGRCDKLRVLLEILRASR